MLSTLKNIATTMLAVLQTRLELIGNELQVQKLVQFFDTLRHVRSGLRLI